MQRQRAPQQRPGGLGIVVSQPVQGRPDQRLGIALHLLCRPQFGPAAAAGVGAIEHGTAERTAIHRSGLEIEQQILQLAARVFQGRAVAAVPGVPDRLDQIDDLGTILLAGLVQLGIRLCQ